MKDLSGFSWRNNASAGFGAGLGCCCRSGAAVHAQQVAQAEPASASAAGSSSTPEAQSPEAKQEEKDENDAYLPLGFSEVDWREAGADSRNGGDGVPGDELCVAGVGVSLLAPGEDAAEDVPRPELGDPEAPGGCADCDRRGELRG